MTEAPIVNLDFPNWVDCPWQIPDDVKVRRTGNIVQLWIKGHNQYADFKLEGDWANEQCIFVPALKALRAAIKKRELKYG